MLINETGRMVGVFEKLGHFYVSCLGFKEKPVNFAPGKVTVVKDSPWIKTIALRSAFHACAAIARAFRIGSSCITKDVKVTQVSRFELA
ncbi:neprilysin-like isoform X1 [Vespula squamosa]|uniref:Neprilysin-like isoform X1 n=1 Tax=Vespula squamosa TaxID=30214 RepID=A0ABD2ATZ5_VESSQ